MKRLIFFALFGVAIWMAWKQWPTLFERKPTHDVIVVNESRSTIERLRVTVGGRTFVRDTLRAGTTFEFPFTPNNDTDIRMVWEWGDRLGEASWVGGRIAMGPLLQRHRIRIDPDGGVVYVAEDKPGPQP